MIHEIKKPVNDVIRAIISCIEPDSQQKVFSAVGFGRIEGREGIGPHEVSIEDPAVLNLNEYRVKYAYQKADEGREEQCAIIAEVRKHSASLTYVTLKGMDDITYAKAGQGYDRLESVLMALK